MSPVDYTHLTIECLGCDREMLNDEAKVRQTLRDAAAICNLRVLKEDLHKFRPHGITGYLLLSESHLSIHTWPEQRFALVDVLSCASIEIDLLIRCFRESLGAGSIDVCGCANKPAGARSQVGIPS